jgi:Acyl-[acyl carrier protein]--UDP-N-acetylglucosamine O-acyltransferase
MERWSPTLRAALATHRQAELPYLAAFFDSAQNDARKGFTREDVHCLLDQFERIYRRHFTLAAATAAPLLADLEQSQIQALAQRFREEAQEDADAGARPEAARVAKRVERYADNLRWWLGELDANQRRIVRAVVADLPETDVWYAYRDRKRRELIALLRRDAAPRRSRPSWSTGWWTTATCQRRWRAARRTAQRRHRVAGAPRRHLTTPARRSSIC